MRPELVARVVPDAALAEYHLPIVSHPNNGDEDLYSNKIGNYSKGLPHNNVGEVDLTAYNSYLAAIRKTSIENRCVLLCHASEWYS